MSRAEANKLGGDLVAVWDVTLSNGVHRIEFAHGTMTGKRVVYVNGQEVIRKDWLFKLVGRETFTVGNCSTKASILIEVVGGAFAYTLVVDGKSLGGGNKKRAQYPQKFTDNQAKSCKTWTLRMGGQDYRVVLEKNTMDVWCNGRKMETVGEFVDDGTETHFMLGGHKCCIKAMSSGQKKSGIVHYLLVDGENIQASTQ